MKNTTIPVFAATICLASLAFGASRDDFLRQQAYAEMQRVTGQIDVIQSNQDDLARRVSKLEKGDGARAETEALRAEIASLRAELSALKRAQDAQRDQIVRDLAKRIDSATAAAPKTTAKPTVPCKEYEVLAGDTLSLIAQAFETTVPRLKELNNLKSDNLRIGQKIKVPAGK